MKFANKFARYVRWALVGFMAFGAVSTWLWFASSSRPQTHKFYSCPMHPSVQSEGPGSCPICGMDLVLRPRGSMNEGPLHISAERQKLSGISVATATRAIVQATLDVSAVVETRQNDRVRVEMRAPGFVEKVLAGDVGSFVARGQVLASVYSPELLAAQEEYRRAKAWHNGLNSALDTSLKEEAKRRLQLLGLSDADLLELDRGSEPKRAIDIVAPRSGSILEKNAVAGMKVEPGTALFELADLSTVWMLADVPEVYANKVKSGMAVKTRVNAVWDRVYDGRIDLLAPTLDAQSRTLQLRVSVANPKGELRPGMLGQVNIPLAAREQLTVPQSSVIRTGARTYVYVLTQEQNFVPRDVVVGSADREFIEILSGLQEGEKVVQDGTFVVDSESRLRTVQNPGDNAHDRP